MDQSDFLDDVHLMLHTLDEQSFYPERIQEPLESFMSATTLEDLVPFFEFVELTAIRSLPKYMMQQEEFYKKFIRDLHNIKPSLEFVDYV